MCGPLDIVCQGIAGGVEAAWSGITMFLFGWFYAIQWWGWLMIGYFIGGVLAAMFGWPAVALPVVGIVFGLLSRNATSKPPAPAGEPWEEPEEPEPSRPQRRNPKSLSDIFADFGKRFRR